MKTEKLELCYAGISIASYPTTEEVAGSTIGAPGRNQLAATRVAEATRASIPSSANCPLPRRTNKVAWRHPSGTNNAMICDCISNLYRGKELTLTLEQAACQTENATNSTSYVPPSLAVPDKNCHR